MTTATITSSKSKLKRNKHIRELLEYCSDTLAVTNDVWTARQSYFFTNGRTVTSLIADIKAALRNDYNVTVIDQGDLWKPFKGGASVANQSHWFVKFTATDKQ